jgi:hypothetical protein
LFAENQGDATMNDDMPWVNLTQEEVEELRNKKYELTEYGKEKLRKLMNKPIEAKVSEEDYQKVLELMNNQQPYPDSMFEEAERREKLNAGFKQDANGNWYRPELKDLSRNERIELAEKEIAYIVMGGQDGREYANSIAFLLQVLDSLRDD